MQEGVFVSSSGGGEISLLGTADAFDGSALNTSLWTSGSWSASPYNPSVAGGQLTLPGGGFVRSSATRRLGTLEVTAQFGAGAWQHVGFAPNGFELNRYLIFSTLSGTTNLYARANNNSNETNVNLGAIPSGMHRYRIEWTSLNANTDQAAFFIDGVQRAVLTAPAGGANNYSVMLSNNGGANLVIDRSDVGPAYVANGLYTGCVLESTSGGWQALSWESTSTPATSVTVESRTSADMVTWSSWGAHASSGTPPAAPGRFLQFRVALTTTDVGQTPGLASITVTPLGVGRAAALDVEPNVAGQNPVYLPVITR